MKNREVPVLTEYPNVQHDPKKHDVTFNIVCPGCNGEGGGEEDCWNWAGDYHYTRPVTCCECKGEREIRTCYDDNDSTLLEIEGIDEEIVTIVRRSIAIDNGEIEEEEG